MAYSFDKINSLFSGQDDQQKVNIFGDQSQGQGLTQNQGQQQSQGQSQPQDKASDAGDIGAGGSSGQTSGGEAKPAAAAQQGAAEVVQKNQGKQQGPSAIGNITNSLSAADKGLQDEANSYVASAKSQDYSLKDSDLEGAISEKTPGEKTSAVLSRLSQAAPTADAFQPKTNVNVDDVNLLRSQTDATGRQSNAGLEQLLRRDYGPEYSGNQARLDTSLLTRDPQFNLIRDQLVNKQDQLAAQAKDYQTSKTKEAQDAETANFTTQTKAIKDALGGKSSALIDANKKEVDTENAARDALRKTLKSGGKIDDLTKAQKTAMDKVAADIQANNPRALQFLKDSGIDAKQFFAISGNLNRDNDYKNFIDANEAQRFNRINELLGGQDSLTAGSVGSRTGFDSAAYQKALGGAVTSKRASADKELQSKIDKILTGEKTNANLINQRRAKLKDDLAAQAASAGQGDFDQLAKGYSEEDIARAKQNFDPSSYYSVGDDVSADALISPEEAMQLQALTSELGGQGAYKQGAGAGQDFTFDRGGYRSALQNLLDNARSGNAADKQRAEAASAQAKPLDHLPYIFGQAADVADQANAPLDKALNDYNPIKAAPIQPGELEKDFRNKFTLGRHW